MQDERSFDYFSPKRSIAWLLVAPHVWIALIAGWAYLFWCFWIGFEIPAAGAVLVCTALIADIMMRSISWGKLRTFSLITQFKLRQHRQGGNFFVSDGFKIYASWSALCLFRLADPGEEFWRENKDAWRASKTAHRISGRIYFCILATAIVGTVVWGYAHLLLV